jgi:hypothetical protein
VQRFETRLGKLSDAAMEEVSAPIAVVIEFEPEPKENA